MNSKKLSVYDSVVQFFRVAAGGVFSMSRSIRTTLPYLLSKNSDDLRKEVTEQYPDPVSSRTADELPPRTRGMLLNDIERCTGCGNCSQVCPTECISVEVEQVPETAKTWVSVFDVDFSRCVFCGLCVDVCPPHSLTHTRTFEYSVYESTDLVACFGRGRVTQDQREKWALARELSRPGDLGI